MYNQLMLLSNMFEKCIYFNSNALARTVNRLWEEAYSKFGLSPAHAYLLRMVLANPGLLPRELATELELSRSTITRFLNSLEADELLVRKPSKEDGRAFEVHPTTKALRLHKALDSTAAALTKSTVDILGKETFTTTVAQLREIRSSLEKD